MKKTNFSIDLIATLQQMIRFTPIGEPDKNAMCKFKVLIPEGTKVKDIIDFALTQDEWGTIEVRHGDITDDLAPNPPCFSRWSMSTMFWTMSERRLMPRKARLSTTKSPMRSRK